MCTFDTISFFFEDARTMIEFSFLNINSKNGYELK